MINRSPVTITSVQPMQGEEGTIVTLKGSGFAPHFRNNCVVVGGMGACARAEPSVTPTEMKVRIGPIAKPTDGDIIMWPGVGMDLHTEQLSFGKTSLRFAETSVFRNAAPVSNANVKFKLTKASPNTYAGYVEPAPVSRVELGGQETGPVMRVRFPQGFSCARHTTVDICLVLKEPTLAIDFSAALSGGTADGEECLRTIAKSITVNAGLVGERVAADVAQNQQTGELELYVTKPYLTNGMVTLRFR